MYSQYLFSICLALKQFVDWFYLQKRSLPVTHDLMAAIVHARGLVHPLDLSLHNAGINQRGDAGLALLIGSPTGRKSDGTSNRFSHRVE